LRDKVPGYDAFSRPDLSGLRVGWMGDYAGYLPMEAGVLDVCESALALLGPAGAVVEDCLPDYDLARLWQTWLTFRHWELSGAKVLYDDPEIKKLLKPEFIWEIEGSFDMPAARVAAAALDRSDWYRALLKLFDKYHVLALPTAQVFPFPIDIHWPKEIGGTAMDTYHRWMEVVIGGTLSGLPVVNLPAGFDDSGRPMGMQFIGRMGEDKQVLEFAMAYEQVTDYLHRRPELQEVSQSS
ncbi:MAG: amidase family protein, partial [Woeseiaceae bacterium]